MLLEKILEGASIGGMLGEAIATIAGANVAKAVATGTLVGAAGAVVAKISETVNAKEII